MHKSNNCVSALSGLKLQLTRFSAVTPFLCVFLFDCYAPINVMPAGGEAGHRVGI